MKTFIELKRILKADLSKLPKLRIAILGDFATQFLSIGVKAWCAERNYDAEVFEAPFNQIEMQCYNPSSELHKFSAQFIVIAQCTHKLNEIYSLMDTSKYSNLADERLKFIKDACDIFRSSTIICCNYPEIDDCIYGNFSNKISSSFLFQQRKLNYELMKLSEKIENLMICDLSSIQNKYGRDYMFDPAKYASTEMIFSVDYIPIVAKRIVDIIMCIRGHEKKCIILDLDNTLWGGIVGDDGISGIELGHGLGIGKMFVEFQEWLLKLKNRGIILCVCSKNNESTAKEPFLNHPDMVLKIDDIAVFLANWESKVSNIRMIQKILNIGFDSMVFLDDSSFERGVVKENIPEITVPELPEDPALYLEYLYSLNLFETSSFSKVDTDRTKQYAANARREEFQNLFDNEEEYLKSLEMISKVDTFNEYNIPRVAQLSQRSNQFNLRTIRYTESEIKTISESSEYISRAFNLSDKFGDNGLIAVVIMKKMDMESLFIESWFMSCRVLNRGMENYILDKLVAIAKENGIMRIIGEYIPTPKNILVKDHYRNLGFIKCDSNKKDCYYLNIDNYKKINFYIRENSDD